MSTTYLPKKNIPAAEALDGRLAKFGVREHIVPGQTSEYAHCLTDGKNYVWVYTRDDDNLIICVFQLLRNSPLKILSALEVAFDTEIYSEHDPRYWGFETKEEWDTWEEKIAQKDEEDFLVEILKYLRGEPANIKPGTVGMGKAEIAKKLVAENPDLLVPSNKEKLKAAIKALWEAENALYLEKFKEHLVEQAVATMAGGATKQLDRYPLADEKDCDEL